MSAPHFFSASIDGDVVSLHGEEARHARASLRIKAGETITVSDGHGGVVAARVVRAGDSLDAEVIERRAVPQPVPRVIIMPAIPKSGKLDVVVEKLTELGVDEIRPWFAERTIVRWDERKVRIHGDRWRAIAFAASKQSRRAWLPVVADPEPLTELPATTVCLHEEGADPLKVVLSERAEAVGIVVGPEGGLSEDEVARMRALGARIASLGEQILRAETAAIAGAVIVLHRFGRMG